MSDRFHLLDLRSQALAVQRLLKGRKTDDKLAWLAERGQVLLASTRPGFPRTYRFVSTVGLDCFFFFDEDEFVFLGDHTTFTVTE